MDRSYWFGLYASGPIETCACNGNCRVDNCEACTACRAKYDSWSDNSNETFRAWRSVDPGSRHGCGRIQPNEGWVSSWCNETFKFICEKGLLNRMVNV